MKIGSLFSVKKKSVQQLLFVTILLYLIFKIVSMIIAAYFGWHCSYEDVTVVKIFNSFLCAIFSEIYLVYIWIRRTFFGKLC